MTDWRTDNARHLSGQPLLRQPYRKLSTRWDHDHCAGCLAKFAELDGPDIQRGGYATTDKYLHGARYEWVCIRCFTDLQTDLGWTEA
jgi:hypothetical protein